MKEFHVKLREASCEINMKFLVKKKFHGKLADFPGGTIVWSL